MPKRHDFGTERSIGEKLQGEIVERQSGPNSYFVEYEDGYDIEPRTVENEILFETDLVQDADDTSIRASGTTVDDTSRGDGHRIDFAGSLSEDDYSIRVDNDEITLTDEDRIMRALSAVMMVAQEAGQTTPVDLDARSATDIYQVYRDVLTSRVRRPRIEDILDGRYIAFTDDGIVIDDTFLVTWEAENYVLDDVQAVDDDGSPRSDADESHEFLGINFETDPMISVEIDGTEYELSETEQRFLALVEVLRDPERYLGTGQSIISEIQQAKLDEQRPVADIAETATVHRYMDPVSGIVHPHGIDKHTLTASFNVRRWVLDEIMYTEFDHAGVNELAWREDEFRNVDRDVFYDVENGNHERWQQIQETADSARVPDLVIRELRAEYGPSS